MQINKLINGFNSAVGIFFGFGKAKFRTPPFKLKDKTVLLQHCAHHFNMWRNPERDGPAVLRHGCKAVIGQLLFGRGGPANSQ